MERIEKLTRSASWRHLAHSSTSCLCRATAPHSGHLQEREIFGREPLRLGVFVLSQSS